MSDGAVQGAAAAAAGAGAAVSIKGTVERQFGSVADAYRTSAVHAAGADLAQLVAAAHLTGRERVLDAGSGAGHTALAFAPQAGEVVSVDLSANMLAQGERLAQERGITNVVFRQGDVEALPFADGSFDLVVSRYSAHHWHRPQQALREFVRLLRPGGSVLIDDIVSYDDFLLDSWLQTIEVLRDQSHVRDHSPAGWLALLGEAGLAGEVIFTWPVRLNFDDWVTRMATPPDAVAVLRRFFVEAPAEVRAALQIEPDDSFTIQGAAFRGRKQDG